MPSRKRVVYIMAMEGGRVKVGITKNSKTLQNRPQQLESEYNEDFDLRYAEQVINASEVEKELRNELKSKRVSVRNGAGGKSREIFRVAPAEAISTLKRLPIHGERKIVCPSSEVASVQSPKARPKNRSQRRTLKRSDIPKGATLTATYLGKRYTCTVVDPGSRPRVRYKNKTGLSLSAAARRITNYGSISGTDFWWYGDIQISELGEK